MSLPISEHAILLGGESLPSLLRLLVLARPYWGQIGLACICLVCNSALGLVMPWVLQHLIDSVLIARDIAMLNLIAIGLAGVMLLQAVFGAAQAFLLSRTGERMVADLRLQVYSHLVSLPLGFFSHRQVGEITSHLTNDITILQGAVTSDLLAFVRQAITLVGGVAAILAIDWRLTMVSLAVAPSAVVGALLGRRLQRLSTRVQDELAAVTAQISETVAGMRIVKGFVRESYERHRFAVGLQGYLHAALLRLRSRALLSPVASLISFGPSLLVIWVGGHEVMSGVLSPGQLVAFLFYVSLVGAPFGTLVSLYGRLHEALGASQRVFELLDATPEGIEVPDAVPPGILAGRVTFRKVSFCYDGRPEAALCDVSLDVRPGEVIALVGPSGAGKTSLVSLIARFHDASCGTVEIDGHDIRSLKLGALREQIGIVPQETLLLSGTIRENIAYGRLSASEEEIIEAARAANAHSFIMALPEGYDTQVGEGGLKLSAGERQRIAIARAFIRNPRILILDEATSSLDSEAEAQIQEALERLMRGRTTFIVAHRLATVSIASRVVVLCRGRVVEEGTAPELLRGDGLYAHLYRLQCAMAETAGQASHMTPEAARLGGKGDSDQ